MKIAIKLILLTVIVVLAYFLWDSIDKPIRFEKQKDKRYNATIQKLKDIRTAELAYLAVHGKFTGDFDTLINFVKNDSIPLVKAIGSVPDTLTEKKALKLGIISRDTSYISTLDSLFSVEYQIDSLSVIPFSKGEKFTLSATILQIGSKVSETKLQVPVFEAKALNRIILKGLDNQLRINLDDEALKMDKYPGLKVGSLTTNINNAGNWE
ncbi:MAG: hypothetical protein JXR51_11995 [Bacteroidales bacterium]|nr:hypothetical protein [Bacteroidales bacterium]MBN2757891.1 hypothetical protein [Bacteroidales bacterium]